mgnify:CR=1 FL=1
MKVIRNVEKKEKFCAICPGTVFMAGSIPYMKIEDVVTCDERTFNAVVLETGEFVRFGGEDPVRPSYDAELLIP